MSSERQTKKITELIDSFLDEIDGKKVRVGEIYHVLGKRTYGSFIFFIGLLTLSPLGAIPGIGIICGLTAFLIAIQYFFKKGGPWLPSIILDREVSSQKAKKSLKKTRPYVEWMEKYLKPRMVFFTRPPFNFLVMGVVIMMSATMIVLTVIPWAITLPALALVLLGLAIISGDGIVMIAGLLLSVGSLVSAFLFIW